MKMEDSWVGVRMVIVMVFETAGQFDITGLL